MFDNVVSVEGVGMDARLRQNLKGFNRDSLRILHPVFVDALRLLARRDHPDRADSLLLPLARPVVREAGTEELPAPEMYSTAGQEEFTFGGRHV